jgi:hypothetical protein
MLANSAELTYAHTSTPGPGVVRRFWDCASSSAAPLPGPSFAYPDSLGSPSNGPLDIATCDLDANGFDEVVTAWAGSGGTLILAAEAPGISIEGTWDSGNRLVTRSTADTVLSHLRLVSGNFDLDPEQELLVAYRSPGGRIVVTMFEMGPSLSLNRVGSSISVPYGASLNGYAQLDIAAGDFDRDGLDEVLLARATAGTPVDVRIGVYDYDWATRTFLPEVDQLVDLRYIDAPTGWRDDFTLSTGDHDGDGVDETVLLYQEGYWKSLLTTAKVDLLMLPFSVSPDLSALGLGNVIECDAWNANVDIPPRGGVSVASRDFDMDGADEVVVAGLSRVAIWQVAAWPAFVRRASETFNTRSGEESRRLIAVADGNAGIAQSSWIPEVFVADYVSSSWLSTATATPRIRTLGVTIDTTANPHAITGFVARGAQDLTGTAVSRFVLAAGDFDGDAVRLRAPRLITTEKFVQPLVVLNVPPTHYDILDGTVFDVCKQYPANSTFKSTYVKASTSTKEFSTRQTKDWSVSGNAGASFKSLLNLNFSATYGEGFAKQSDSGSSIQITDQVFTSGDDYVFASVSEYAFWEYPLYAGGAPVGNVLVTRPALTRLSWLPSKNPDLFHFEPSHEVGNVLSYMPTATAGACFDVEEMVCTDFQSYTLSEKAGKTWEVFLSQSQGSEQEWSKTVGIEVGASLSGWGLELGVKGSYNQKDVTTHKSKATRDVKITLEVGEPDASLGMADYAVSPMVYWSRTGALVVDFATQPAIWQYADTSLRTWWQRHYMARPDPALILPWRYDVEKTGDTVSARNLRNLTKSLRLSPTVAELGDTVKIGVRIFNYSLLATPTPVVVRFYVGDPSDGSTPIVGLGGVTELTTTAPLPARGSAFLSMRWIVGGPGRFGPSTRIYALLDPAHAMEEIHKDNNVGWTILTIPGIDGVADGAASPLPDCFRLDQNYPNPFNPSTVIGFHLPVEAAVKLAVFDLLGREVSVLVDERKPAGAHTVVFDGRNLATGVYFCRLRAGAHVETRKLLLVR